MFVFVFPLLGKGWISSQLCTAGQHTRAVYRAGRLGKQLGLCEPCGRSSPASHQCFFTESLHLGSGPLLTRSSATVALLNVTVFSVSWQEMNQSTVRPVLLVRRTETRRWRFLSMWRRAGPEAVGCILFLTSPGSPALQSPRSPAVSPWTRPLIPRGHTQASRESDE